MQSLPFLLWYSYVILLQFVQKREKYTTNNMWIIILFMHNYLAESNLKGNKHNHFDLSLSLTFNYFLLLEAPWQKAHS